MTEHVSSARTLPERLAAIATAVAAAVVVVAIAILPFLSPVWVAFEQGRTNAAALTGFSEADLRTATNSILHDLVLGPPEFAVEVAGAPVLDERERSHMRDVRGVFGVFGLLAAAAAVGLVVLVVGARRMGHPERASSAIGAGMRWLIGGIVVAAVIVTVAFDVAFDIFHRLFFPGGSYTFDPGSDRLVQLFPFAFWSETTIVLGAVIIGLAVVVALAARRASRASPAQAHGARGGVASQPEAAR